MLRFNPNFRRNALTKIYFNTSYVTVQQSNQIVRVKLLARFQYILCYGSTGFFMYVCFLILEFQYILCYGSTTNG